MPAPAQPRPLVLASASPRRRELLRQAGFEFEVVPAPLEEHVPDCERLPAELHAEALAYYKARCVAAQQPQAVVLGADTLVSLQHHKLGKPRDRDDARRILSMLSGSRHQVVTGLAIIAPGGERRLIRHDVTDLEMTPLSAEQLEAYLDTDEWRDKAGAYAIQETGDRYVRVVRGSWSNVVGMPLEMLGRMCKEWLSPPA